MDFHTTRPTERTDVKVVFFAKQDWKYYADKTEPRLHPNAFESFVLLDVYDQKVNELNSENIELRMKNVFGNYCEHCEPVYCCNGQMCGCQAAPTGFISTVKCGPHCSIKAWEQKQKDDQLRDERLNQLESLLQRVLTHLPKEEKMAALYFIANNLTLKPEPQVTF